MKRGWGEKSPLSDGTSQYAKAFPGWRRVQMASFMSR